MTFNKKDNKVYFSLKIDKVRELFKITEEILLDEKEESQNNL
ncbi:hypothetical protein PL321_18865 [Caloramator sp. mosi_1]|nr:hypothetical protein [Caloramator sp. mosi_1]WDC84247.1 hypothetical protein PL321_18865 [Caloramator sp. mosi_1]